MQTSFSDLEYAAKKKLTQRDRFLAEIDSVTPWGKLHKAVEPFYPKVVRQHVPLHAAWRAHACILNRAMASRVGCEGGAVSPRS